MIREYIESMPLPDIRPGYHAKHEDSLADCNRAVQKGEEVVRVEAVDIMKLLNVNI